MLRRVAVCVFVSALVALGLVASAAVGQARPASAGAVGVAGAFVPITPTRVLDTAAGLGAHAPGGHATIRVPITGHAGIPATGVSAVVLNLIVSHPTALGYLTAYPDGTPRPGTANLAFHAGPTTTNLTVATLGSTGASTGYVDIYNGAPSTQQLQADITGYYLAGTPTVAGTFVPTTPTRVLDTAAGLGTHAPGGHATIRVPITGHAGIPATGVSAVVLNLIVSHPTALGYLTAYPDGTARPGTANLAFHAGPTTTNLTVATLGSTGASTGYVDIYNGAPSTQQLQADITGYYLAGTPTVAGTFVPTTPTRLLDTAAGLGTHAPGGHATIRVPITGHAGIPATGVSAVVLNLIVSHPTALGYLTAYPDGTARPGTANLAFHAGPTTTNLTIAQLGNTSASTGDLDIYNGAPTSQQLQADITGYYLSGPTVTGLFPNSGPPAGGTTVTLTGTGFTTGATVEFGAVAGTAVTVTSPTTLTVTAPAHPLGTVDVTVTTPAGTSAPTGADDYSFVPSGTLSVIAGRCVLDPSLPATRNCFEPGGLAADSAGNLYLADYLNHVVEKVTPSGTLSIVAGDRGFGAPTPGPATSSKLGDPAAVAIDPSGNLYIADVHNDVVEKVTAAGALSIVAGTGTSGRPTPGPATRSDLGSPRGVTLDPGGNLYIADDGADVVEKVTAGGTLSIVAGGGGTSQPTPGPATSSNLIGPNGVAVDRAGNLYIADAYTGDPRYYDGYTSVVEKVTPAGTLSIVAGTGVQGKATPGPATRSDLGTPIDVAVDSAGTLYIADNGDAVVEKVTPAGTLSVVADSALGAPVGIAVDPTGNLYITDGLNDVVQKLTAPGTVSVVAGVGVGSTPVPGPATRTDLGDPAGVAVDPAGNLYITDTYDFNSDDNAAYNSVVEKVTPTGTLSIVAGTGKQGTPTPGPAASSDLDNPAGLAADAAGNLYIADSGNNTVEKVTPGGTLSIVAGTQRYGPPTPGPATRSHLDTPTGVAVDAAGNLYIADSFNEVVEKVTPGGTLSIVAGTGRYGAPTPGPATSSDLDNPAGVAVDAAGNLYIADQQNKVVEKVTPSGTLTIVAGTGGTGAPTPGPATTSNLGPPAGVAIDPAGNLYIADHDNLVVERVTPAGTLSIVAGTGGTGAPTPGPATSSNLGSPAEVATDVGGNLYIADADNSVVERVT